VRQYLNFGHTIGHAIEFASNLSHGEAVSIGMVAAAALSEKRLGFDGVGRLVAALEGLGLPVSAAGIARQRVLDLVRLDKKRDGDSLRMVLLEEVGKPVVVPVDAAEVDHALAAIGI
jgi:3-dehydroquinate synthetase